MTEPDKATMVASRLGELRQKFAARAAEDLEALEQLALSLRDEDAAADVVSDLLASLHRLAGSAGTFGFPELGEAARNLEKMLKAGAEDGVPDLAVEKLLALRTLLDNPPLPAESHKVKGLEQFDEESCHGVQVQVLLFVDHESDNATLELALTAYGFDCRFVGQAELEQLDTLATGSIAATVILASDSWVASVLRQRDASRAASVRRVPVVCLGRKDDFSSRYQMAGMGADAFFGVPANLPDLTERIEYLAMERSTRVSGRVVIVEDDAELAEHYSLVLTSAGVEVCRVSHPRELMTELSTFQPDILLMDVQLGEYSGTTLARMVRFDSQWLSLPIIYLSSEDDPDNQLEALSRGADEFLMKPVSDSYLVRSVLIRCFRARQLSRLMNRDSLTGLLKHSLIKQEVEQELARCLREGRPASVVMVDLDHFKAVNDHYGHRCGDVVIKALANMLRNRLRETDKIGRYGGEEFLIVLSGCHTEAARRLMADIATAFAQLTFTGGEQGFQVTLSAGIAAIEEFGSGDEAIEAADQALYERKRSGRNGVTLYGQEE